MCVIVIIHTYNKLFYGCHLVTKCNLSTFCLALYIATCINMKSFESVITSQLFCQVKSTSTAAIIDHKNQSMECNNLMDS